MCDVDMGDGAGGFNAAIGACDGAGRWEWAMSLAQQLLPRALSPTAVTVASAISACAERWELGLRWLCQGPWDLVCWNGALSACEKGGQSQAAARLARAMREEGLQPDTISQNTLSSTFAQEGLWQASLRCLCVSVASGSLARAGSEGSEGSEG